MPLPADLLGPWGNRVRFSPEQDGFAYRPGVFLTPGDNDTRGAVASVLGADRAVVDVPNEGDELAIPAELPGGYVRWRYPGDTLRAVRQLRAAGVTKAQPVHVFFADGARRDHDRPPLQANPVYANPVYANPVYANPVYANPVYANPVYANPVYANPVYANPVYANPVYVNGDPGGRDREAAGPAGGNAFAPLSRVYPNPVYARQYLTAELAARYRATGARASQAHPAAPDPRAAGLFAEMPDWNDCPIRVAVLDTGLDKVLAHDQCDSVDKFDSQGDHYLDPVSGHGTFILGLIRRIAPSVAVCVKQALSTFGDGQEDAVCVALGKLAALDPSVVNLSFGGYTLDKPEALNAAIATVTAKGAVVVASAGNDSVDRLTYPAGLDGVIAVGALGPDGPATFSNYGDWVNACAPGVDLTSAFFNGDGEAEKAPNYDPDRFCGRAVWSGTSFAAPVVAAAIARAMAAPNAPTTTADAVAMLIDQPGLWQLPGYGTVVNLLAARPDLVG